MYWNPFLVTFLNHTKANESFDPLFGFGPFSTKKSGNRPYDCPNFRVLYFRPAFSLIKKRQDGEKKVGQIYVPVLASF